MPIVNRFGLKQRKNRQQAKFSKFQLMGIPYYAILLFLIVLPMILIVIYSVTEREANMFFSKITLKYFGLFLSEKIFIKTVITSLKLSILTTIITLFVGYLMAYGIHKSKPKWQSILILLVTAPMWINLLLRVSAWKQILEVDGPIIKLLNALGFSNIVLLGSDFAIILGMSYVYLPFMILPIYAILSKIDIKVIEASEDLGASNWQTFKKIIFPLTIPGILSGILMVLLPSATTLVIPKYLGEGRYLIGNLIEEKFLESSNWSYGSAIAIILAVIIMAMVYITKKIDKYDLE